jgi:ABC-type uncharacterized transport system substrate-binding protein
MPPFLSAEAGMKRREFIGLIGGAATVWPLAARSQQDPHIKLIGVLSSSAATPALKARLEVFLQAMLQLGWSAGRNARFDIRWGEGDPDIIRKQTEDLVALAPDIIFVSGSSALAPLQQATRKVPIVFTTVVDPVGAGYVASLAQPGGNITGFMETVRAVKRSRGCIQRFGGLVVHSAKIPEPVGSAMMVRLSEHRRGNGSGKNYYST